MKVVIALVAGVAVGAAAVWFFQSSAGRSTAQSVSKQVGTAAVAARDAAQETWRGISLKPEDIKEELTRTGAVVRKKAEAAGAAISDATADARITGAIKAKLVASKELSALSISVNTTAGVVTLSGAVNSAQDISRAMVLAMEIEGVREVISTLQVTQK